MSFPEPKQTRLEHLFDMVLEHHPGMAPVSAAAGEVGDYAGSGEGSAFGVKISGVVQWDLFREEEEGDNRMHLRAAVRTDDGQTFDLDALGYLTRAESAYPTRWLVSATARFDAGQTPYNWLNKVPAIMIGEYDMATTYHAYRIFVVRR